MLDADVFYYIGQAASPASVRADQNQRRPRTPQPLSTAQHGVRFRGRQVESKLLKSVTLKWFEESQTV